MPQAGIDQALGLEELQRKHGGDGMSKETRMSNDELPNGWLETKLEVVAEVTMGQSPESKFYNDKGLGLPFFQGKAEFGAYSPTARKWCSEPTKIAMPNDILLSIRAPVGPTNRATEKCCIGRGLASIRAKQLVEQNYIHKYLKHLGPWLSEQGTGTTFRAISGDFIRAIPFPLAPLAEQKRIAEKLEAVLGRVDACRARLDRVPALLKRFRQSILAAATSGKLTEEWRMTNGVNDEWENTDLLNICSSISDGDHLPPPQTATGIPFLTIGNISSGQLDFTNVRYVPEPYFEKIRATRVPKPGDTLYSVVGASIGIPVMVEVDRKFCFQRHIAILKPSERTSPSFSHILMASPEVFREAWSRTTGTAQPTLPLGALRTIPVSVPTLPEQQEIVRRVEALFAIADRIEARLATAQKTVERLTPATLAKAFRGELVPQDPNDEPASALLERLKSQPLRKAHIIKRKSRS